MNRTAVLPVLAVLLLAGCGDDPPSACFASADHAKYSDGKITAMCGCAVRQVSKWGVTDKDSTILAAAIRGKSVGTDERARAQKLGELWAMAMKSCRKD